MNKNERIECFNNIDLYPVISSEWTNGRDCIDVLKAIADGGAKIVQLREKNITKQNLYYLAEKYREVTSKYKMLLIINDHIDVALSVDADGVHLGQDDLPLTVAQKISKDLILGISTHNEYEIKEGNRLNCDYMNIGPIFTTQTKTLSMKAIGLSDLKRLAQIAEKPFTVMGGIKANHIPQLIEHNASKIAMVTEITQAENITERVKQLRELFI